MDPLAMFVPLLKADAAQRLVYGSIDETPDRVGEVMDYATAKPAFEEWSKTFSDATGGLSFGNVRAQHDLKKAAGKLTEITFDDDARRISFVAKIVDDQEWAKVEEGVYTGFSPGGSYAKRWQDGSYRRYTPRVGELSIVDIPCIPSGVFSFVKADGTAEDREFVLSKAYEPGNDATKARAEEMAKAAAGTTFKDHVMQARADLIAENAQAELAKMATEIAEPEPVVDDKVAAALAKADAAIASATIPAIAETGPFADLGKAAEALRAIGGQELAKGLWQISRLADLVDSFKDLTACVTYEANSEGDGSAQPAKAIEALKAMGDLLCMMAQEEVAEMLADLPDQTLVLVDVDAPVMALAADILDLVKADADLMEKAGARNSKGDAAKIQSMHDNAVKLGATCDSADKAVGLAAENERLAKSVGDVLPRIEKLVETVETLSKAHATATETVTTLTAEIELLKAQPAAPKGAVMAVSKQTDADGTAPAETAPDISLVEAARRAAAH